MRLDVRKEKVLDFIVRDFVRTAFPVSSGHISEKRLTDLSPATIRNIMLELNDAGYLYQPHTSAGRAPTENGYRYFVDNLMEVRFPEPGIRHDLDAILGNLEQETNAVFDNMSRALSGHLKLFSGIGFLDRNEKIFGKGLPEVFREPEFEEHNFAVEFADFAENMASNLRDIDYAVRVDEFEPHINIKRFGLVSIAFDDEEFGQCALFSFGPKRMNYEKAVSALKYAAKDITSRAKKKKKNGSRR